MYCIVLGAYHCSRSFASLRICGALPSGNNDIVLIFITLVNVVCYKVLAGGVFGNNRFQNVELNQYIRNAKWFIEALHR